MEGLYLHRSFSREQGAYLNLCIRRAGCALGDRLGKRPRDVWKPGDLTLAYTEDGN